MSTQGHHLNKLGNTRVLDTAYQLSRSSAVWFQRRSFFSRVLPYMGQGHGGQIGHVTWTIWTNFHSTIQWRLHMKFNLKIEVGRHHGFPRHDRLCRLCKDEVENEIHFDVSMSCIWNFLFDILMSSHSETVIHNVATYLYYHLNYNKSYLKVYDSISLDVMIYYMLDGIPYLCTCNVTIRFALFHVLWAGGLNHNEPFVLVLENRRSRA